MVLLCLLHTNTRTRSYHLDARSPQHTCVTVTLLRRDVHVVLNPEVVVEVEKRMNRCYLPSRLLPNHLKCGGGPALPHHRKTSIYPTSTGNFILIFHSFLVLFFAFFCSYVLLIRHSSLLPYLLITLFMFVHVRMCMRVIE
jgi:hypothetical protein